MNPFSERCSGILLHPTSLPGPHGVGDLGPQAHRFVDFLARAGQRYWQMLPVGPLVGPAPWASGPAELKRREPPALERARQELEPEVRYHEFLQFEFARQWSALKGYANWRGLKLLGDVPMFVAHDGSDVWANQSIFQL